MRASQRSRRAAALLSAAALTAAVTVGCGTPSDPAPVQPNGSGSAAASAAGEAAACPLPARNVQEQTATPLTFKITELTNGTGFNYALTEATLQKYPQLLSTGRTPEWSLQDAWTDGLFLLGGARAMFLVRNSGTEPVTITNVRLVNIAEECMPLAMAYIMNNEGGAGGEFVALTFTADADTPLAYEESSNGTATVPYFNGRTVKIAPGEERDFTVKVGSLRRPYSFDLAFDVTTGGSTGVQLLRNGNVPFRFAPRLCPTAAERGQLTPDDLAWMKSKLFKNVRLRVDILTMAEKDPAKYSGPCNTL
ncbi:hypothetical protein [Catellatospora chokoriensis]|uniref:Lipoprotein n=1 Tax=Catellatospora chokoriensis TaxID=310353 RepID=A0A8J3K3R3_9ACTN|nr:hypothetical protein [Catellatospora chokoriensis]GIF92348.1 hypothetical protein Cch02nite_57920 [Catellatospora chokoriensis]